MGLRQLVRHQRLCWVEDLSSMAAAAAPHYHPSYFLSLERLHPRSPIGLTETNATSECRHCAIPITSSSQACHIVARWYGTRTVLRIGFYVTYRLH